ncbi:MAG: energy transducer TonB [Rhodothermales bacterium]
MRDLRRRYPLYVQLGLLLSLALAIAAFSVPLRFSEDIEVIRVPNEPILPTEIEITQHRPDPPPPRPPAPIEVETVVDEITVELPPLDPTTEAPLAIPPLPIPPDLVPEPEPAADVSEIFEVVEDPPVLLPDELEGLRQLQRRARYPELARRAGIEGTVLVQFVVDEQGNVVDPVCVRDPGGQTCEEAIRAVRDAEFKPGRQRGKPVKVRFRLPVRFRLR